MRTKPLPIEALRSAFGYVRETGVLIHAFKPVRCWEDQSFNEREAGARACRVDGNRVVVYFEGECFTASRVIWAMVTGTDPLERLINHADLDPTNNRFENLRLLDHSGHAVAKPQQRNNTTGYVGVAKRAGRGYVCHVMGQDGVRHWRFGFATARDAAIERDNLARQFQGPSFRSSIEQHDLAVARSLGNTPSPA